MSLTSCIFPFCKPARIFDLLHFTVLRQMLNSNNGGQNFLGVDTIDEYLYSSEFLDEGILFDDLIVYSRESIKTFFQTNFCDLHIQENRFTVPCEELYGSLSF